MNTITLPGMSDAYVLALATDLSASTAERAAARAELIKRGGYTPAQEKANRKPKPFVPTEGGGSGWGYRS